MTDLVFDGMTGELTAEDIQVGIRCNHEACPLARALENMFPGHHAFIDDYAVLHNKDGETSPQYATHRPTVNLGRSIR